MYIITNNYGIATGNHNDILINNCYGRHYPKVKGQVLTKFWKIRNPWELFVGMKISVDL